MDPIPMTEIVKDLKKKMDLVCRTCLHESNNSMKPIFRNDDDICKMLQACSGLNINALDGFPSNMCSDCLNKLLVSYKFRQLCLISHNTLQNFIDINFNGVLDLEIDNRSQQETTQTNTKLRDDFEIYKCSLCPNQYTLLVQLQEHFMTDHRVEYETNVEAASFPIINRNASELFDKDNSSSPIDLIMDCVEEKYKISEADLSSINNKDGDEYQRSDELSDDSNDNSFEPNDDDDEYHQSDEEYNSESNSSSSFGNELLNSNDWITDDQEDPPLIRRKKESNRKLQQHNDDNIRQADQDNSKNSILRTLLLDETKSLNGNPYSAKSNDKECTQAQYRDHDKRHQCDQCSLTFARKANLRRHCDQRHRNKCRFCQQKFQSKQERYDHQKVHMKERPFVCTECGKQFVQNNELIYHMHRHKGEKPYKCKFCDKGFPTPSSVTIHQRYHTGENMHLCSICGSGFARAYGLKRHMEKHTKERSYKCSLCDKNFRTDCALKAHEKRHKRKLLKCDICGDSFRYLEKHKRIRHGNKSLCKCEICGDSFLHLTKHKRIRHGINEIATKKFITWFIAKLNNFK